MPPESQNPGIRNHIMMDYFLSSCYVPANCRRSRPAKSALSAERILMDIVFPIFLQGDRMKKIFLLVIASAIVVMCLGACSNEKNSVVKVGVIAELTGDMPAVGESCKKAAEMAVKEVNDAGGLDVGGKKYKVELFIEDNAGKSDQSAAAAQKLITQQKGHALIGPNATRYALPASEIA